MWQAHACYAHRVTHRDIATIATQYTRVQPLVTRLFILHLVQFGGWQLCVNNNGLVTPNRDLQCFPSLRRFLQTPARTHAARMHARRQDNATQRNATQRNATQRNANMKSKAMAMAMAMTAQYPLPLEQL
jgi:hypothetical protein